MQITFSKYQGTGNDFVMLDNRSLSFDANNQTLINHLCDRRFGIGGDGLILLQSHPDFDFEMVYFNADGSQSTMCGNGGRCIVAFAKMLGVIQEQARFLAIDGPHEAKINAENWVELKMSDVSNINIQKDHYILNTGSPHYVIFVEDLTDIDVVENGQAIRYSDAFRKEGINVNFVEKRADAIEVATYERGVEAETFSCGTGVTAAAISHYLQSGMSGASNTPIITKGGHLSVRFEPNNTGGFEQIWLCGPATKVFEGKVNV